MRLLLGLFVGTTLGILAAALCNTASLKGCS